MRLLKEIEEIKSQREGLEEVKEDQDAKIAELNINLTQLQLELLQEK